MNYAKWNVDRCSLTRRHVVDCCRLTLPGHSWKKKIISLSGQINKGIFFSFSNTNATVNAK